MTPLEALIAQRRDADEAIEAYRRALLFMEEMPRPTEDESIDRFVEASVIVDRLRPALDQAIANARALEALAASPTDGAIARGNAIAHAQRAFAFVQSTCDVARAIVLHLVAEPKERGKCRKSC